MNSQAPTDASPPAARAEALLREADALARALRLPEALAGIAASASIGVAALGAGETLEHALAAAEAACKRAKLSGGNRVETFAADPSRLLARQQELRTYHELLEALEHGRLCLYAQRLAPLWDPSRAEHYEVLLRLKDAQGRVVAAEEFIPVARRHQLLARLDEWVLGEFVRRAAPVAGLLQATGTVFSLNLSEQSVEDPGLAARVAAALRAAQLTPSLLSFEISEPALAGRLPAVQALIAELGALGCHSSIDDFGTGATSLAYLKALRVSSLKIDGEFVRDLLREPRSESMVRAILQIARQLELDTVAECVESRDAATQLATLGVTYGQGGALGEPQPLAACLEGIVARAASRAAEPALPGPAPKRVH